MSMLIMGKFLYRLRKRNNKKSHLIQVALNEVEVLFHFVQGLYVYCCFRKLG